MLELAAVFICFTALLTYVNYRFVGLPPTIGVMVIALVFSVLLQIASWLGFPLLEESIERLIQRIDFNELLMNWMLSFLLFAGALHVDFSELRNYRWPIGLLATVGVLFSTALIGGAAYWILPLLGWQVDLLYCLLFGALISPTDPIAVLGILRSVGAPKSLEITIVGESLFNDGVAVVVFTVLLGILVSGTTPSTGEAVLLFAEEALGGVLLGAVIGYVTYHLLKSIDQYQIEVLLTLALVIGGTALAPHLHVSGPISMVVAGLIIGNRGRQRAMSDITRQYVDGFWELIDEILNALLFVLIGMELLLLPVSGSHLVAALTLAVVILLIRCLSVTPVVFMSSRWRHVAKGTMGILTWGALRGGISVALALSLPVSPERDLVLTLTYIIVLLSILLQGLTIGRLIRRVTGATTSERSTTGHEH
ncbi:CPA1 family monovalent cation:H+ antiporter [Pseudomonas duriflava]|uniref:CPA1 family monovalent cation:H+ antiporter n=1 Tax=Pseudomonas duriflava TaxID=459528 RepID=A0A562Q8E7_9PSED|nr:sodium:proton antiporter [Pseudomonas duriflava]TWI52296.1 CPA1 family monovalent cation:H+ antiporter [Pseudomonas duriflava]